MSGAIDGFNGPLLTTEKFFGLRCFQVDSLHRLRALNFADAIWRPGENQAQCRATHFSGGWKPIGEVHDSTNPMGQCACGFYGYFNESAPEARVNDHQMIHAVVSAWGSVVAGRKEFRASKAQIECLVLPIETTAFTFHRTHTEVAKLYDVPVYRTLKVALRKHPLSVFSNNLDPATDEFWTTTAP